MENVENEIFSLEIRELQIGLAAARGQAQGFLKLELETWDRPVALSKELATDLAGAIDSMYTAASRILNLRTKDVSDSEHR